jgi:hypothetical protein
MYRTLDPEKINQTAETLRRRVEERFPDSGLLRVADELIAIGDSTCTTYLWLGRPIRWIRAAVATAFLLLASAAAGLVSALSPGVEAFSSVSDFFQGLDALINDLVFIGAAVYFLMSWERRVKRTRALGIMRALRAIAHIIDMHQLTKDPERIAGTGWDTASSPRRQMTPFELTRYLDYCSEMLALVSKLAALLVQRFDDANTLAAVNEIEELTAGLSRKIWQKIVILDRIIGASPSATGASPRPLATDEA